VLDYVFFYNGREVRNFCNGRSGYSFRKKE